MAFARDGTLYAGSLSNGADTAAYISRSMDGGCTWDDHPSIVTTPRGTKQGLFHALWLATDPTDAEKAYAVWFESFGDAPNRRWSLWFSETGDRGNRWSEAEKIYDPGAHTAPDADSPSGEMLPRDPILRVFPNGSLLVVFAQVDVPAEEQLPRWRELAIRSTDGGDHWNAPVEIGTSCDTMPQDPITQQSSPLEFARPSPSLDVGRNGTAYVAWHAIRCGSPPSSQIRIAGSTEGGRSWTALRPVNDDAVEAFMPTLAVGPTGAVAVTYYDFRNTTPSGDGLKTDVWFAHSHDRGVSWEETHLTGFDRSNGGPAGGTDFMGLAAFSCAFAASFGAFSPSVPEPPIDVFFARAEIPSGCLRTTGGGWLNRSAGGEINFGFHA